MNKISKENAEKENTINTIRQEKELFICKIILQARATWYILNFRGI